MRKEFDRRIIQRNWDKIQEGPLKKLGLLARRVMIREIPSRKRFTPTGRRTKAQKPPKAPRSVNPKGKYSFKKVFSVPGHNFVMIGHQGFGQTLTPMEKQEFGKRITVNILPKKKGKRRISRLQRNAARRKFQSGKIKSKKLRKQLMTLPKRKFAEPTLKITTRKYLPKIWKGSFNPETVKVSSSVVNT